MNPPSSSSAGADDEDENDEDEENKQKKKRETIQTSSVKSFMSSILAPRNSANLGSSSQIQALVGGPLLMLMCRV